MTDELAHERNARLAAYRDPAAVLERLRAAERAAVRVLGSAHVEGEGCEIEETT